MIGSWRAVPLLNYILAFALQRRQSTENLSKRRRIVLDTNHCVNLAALLAVASTDLLNISPPRLTVGNLRQPVGGKSAFKFSELRGSTHQLHLPQLLS
jgi:hypothetical protein